MGLREISASIGASRCPAGGFDASRALLALGRSCGSFSRRVLGSGVPTRSPELPGQGELGSAAARPQTLSLLLCSSKVSRDTLYEAVREVLHGNQRKRRK